MARKRATSPMPARFGSLIVGTIALLGATLTVTGAGPAGAVDALGSSPHAALNAPIVAVAATPPGTGYWQVASDGGIFSSGSAQYFGSTGALHLNRPIVGMASSVTGNGYWLVATDGGIFAFGDARFAGSTGALRLNQPIVGMASTPSGKGYWLVARDGGIFSFGDARFFGSTGALRLNQPIVGMASTPSGNGYWLVATDGGIFAFGDARFFGSTGATHLNQPIVGMAPASDGAGYILGAADGGVFPFGSMPFYGSAATACPGSPAVSVATSRGARGYWIAFADARAYALSPSSAAPVCGPSAGGTRAELAARDFFDRMNSERQARGVAPLVWNDNLATYAAGWSQDMASNGFRHSDIGKLLGTFNYVGENIASGRGGVTAGVLHVAWMRSDGHRANILAPGFTNAGVGVYCAADGSMFATTDFGRAATAGAPPAPSPMPPVDPIARPEPGSNGC